MGFRSRFSFHRLAVVHNGASLRVVLGCSGAVDEPTCAEFFYKE